MKVARLGLSSYVQACISLAVILVFAVSWYDLLRQYFGWVFLTPFLVICVACIAGGAMYHAFTYSRAALTALRTATVGITIFAMVFGYGPGFWVWPVAIVSLALTSIASGRQWAHIRSLTINRR